MSVLIQFECWYTVLVRVWRNQSTTAPTTGRKLRCTVDFRKTSPNTVPTQTGIFNIQYPISDIQCLELCSFRGRGSAIKCSTVGLLTLREHTQDSAWSNPSRLSGYEIADCWTARLGTKPNASEVRSCPPRSSERHRVQSCIYLLLYNGERASSASEAILELST